MNRSSFLAAVLFVLIGVPDLAAAQHAAKAQGRNQDAAGEGVKVAADPATGKLRPPTREEVEELLQGMTPYLDQSGSGLRELRGAGGAVGLDLQDRFQSVSVARASPGGVETECVTSPAEARAFLERDGARTAPKAPVTPALEEK